MRVFGAPKCYSVPDIGIGPGEESFQGGGDMKKPRPEQDTCP